MPRKKNEPKGDPKAPPSVNNELQPILNGPTNPSLRWSLKDGTEEIGYDRKYVDPDNYEDKPNWIRRLVNGEWTPWEPLPADYKLPPALFSKEWFEALPDFDREQLLDIFLRMHEGACRREAEKALEDSQHRQVMLDLAEFFHNRQPSVRRQRQAELDQMMREFKAKRKEERDANRFVIQEIRRMNALPEPLFVLDLPDDVIRKLLTSRFDTVGKLLFGVMVDLKRMSAAMFGQDDFDLSTAQWVYREQLLEVVGLEGYNLIGSRLMQFGYLQRNHFLSELKHEHVNGSNGT